MPSDDNDFGEYDDLVCEECGCEDCACSQFCEACGDELPCECEQQLTRELTDDEYAEIALGKYLPSRK